MPSGNIFINYRRGDTAGTTGRLVDRLAAHFGRERVFFDVDVIPPGLNFVDFLSKQVALSEVMLVIIGPSWLGALDEAGRSRLENQHDFVRLEIQAALERNIPKIPLLVDGVAMPRRDQLPEAIRQLATRNGLEIRHVSFNADVERLIEGIEQLGSLAPMAEKSAFQSGRAPLSPSNKSFVAFFAQERRAGEELSKLMEAIELQNLSLIDEAPSIQAVEEHLRFFPAGQSRPLAIARLEYLFFVRFARNLTQNCSPSTYGNFPLARISRRPGIAGINYYPREVCPPTWARGYFLTIGDWIAKIPRIEFMRRYRNGCLQRTF